MAVTSRLNVVQICDHPRLAGDADARRQAVVRLDAPALRRRALQREPHQPALAGHVRRAPGRPRHRRDVPVPVEVRSLHPSGAPRRAGDQARGRRPAPAWIRRHHLRPPGGGPPRLADAAARAREPDRHALVPEDRGPASCASHRPRHRGLAFDGRVRDPGAQGAVCCHPGRLSRRPTGRVLPAANVRRRSGRSVVTWGCRPAFPWSAPSPA